MIISHFLFSVERFPSPIWVTLMNYVSLPKISIRQGPSSTRLQMCGFADLWVTKVVTWGVEMKKMNSFFLFRSLLTNGRLVVDCLLLLILTWLVIAVEFVPKLFLEWIILFASNLKNSQFSAICRCQNHSSRCQDSYLGTKDLDFGNNPPFAKMKTFMRSHSCMKSGVVNPIFICLMVLMDLAK